ncbi:MAG: YncE family protein [Deltaproteobacteria bacterium]|nr:YncE family protein [Deltaproteobacteria bacterium]
MFRISCIAMAAMFFIGCPFEEQNQKANVILCNTEFDCPSKAYKCDDGYCRLGGNECEQDDNCQSPVTSCQLLAGAYCKAGYCVYELQTAGSACQPDNKCYTSGTCNEQGACDPDTKKLCDITPEPECTNDNTLIVSNPIGECIDGECVYATSEKTCASCPGCLSGCLLDTNDDGTVEEVASGISKPDNKCLICSPETSRSRWTTRPCFDENKCTDDTCDPDIGCKYTPNDTHCNDGVDCTIDSCDIVNGCMHNPDPTRCSDDIYCTNDICDIKQGCQYFADNNRCNDNEICTIDVCIADSGCEINFDGDLCHHLAFNVTLPKILDLNAQWPTFEVYIEDAQNNLVLNANHQVSIKLIKGTGKLDGTTEVNAIAGVATFKELKYETKKEIEEIEIEASAAPFASITAKVRFKNKYNSNIFIADLKNEAIQVFSDNDFQNPVPMNLPTGTQLTIPYGFAYVPSIPAPKAATDVYLIINKNAQIYLYFDGKVQTIITPPYAKNLHSIAVHPSNKLAYVEAEGVGVVLEIKDKDLEITEVENIHIGYYFTPDGTRAYNVVEGINPSPATVWVTNTVRHLNIAIIDLPKDTIPKGCAITADSTRMYITDWQNSKILVLNIDSNSKGFHTDIQTIELKSKNPSSIALTPFNDFAYIAYDSGGVDVLDTNPQNNSYHQIIKTITDAGSSGGEHSIMSSDYGNKMYVTTNKPTGKTNLWVIDSDPNSKAFNEVKTYEIKNYAPFLCGVTPIKK